MNVYDLHTHTELSFDSSTSLETYMQAVVDRRLAGVAVTDHGSIEGALAMRERRPPFQVIVGCEFTLDDDSHLIGLFLTSPIRASTLKHTSDAIRAQGGLVVLPHPFRSQTGHLSTRRTTAELSHIMRCVDAIEVFNAKSSGSENHSAMELALQRNMPVTAGSDAHRASHIGKGYVSVEHVLTPESLLGQESHIIGIDQSCPDLQRAQSRREGLRRLALRFKRTIPARVWKHGKAIWENACDQWDAADDIPMKNYGGFRESPSTGHEQRTHSIR